MQEDQELVLAVSGDVLEPVEDDGSVEVAGDLVGAIRVGDDMPAAFVLSTTRSMRRWSEADIQMARAIADHTGLAIRQAELYQKAEATSMREKLVNRLSLAIRASLSMSEVLETATRELGQALAASRVYLRIYDSANTESQTSHEYVAKGVARERKRLEQREQRHGI